MTLSPPDIKAILDPLEASDWGSASVTVDSVTISVARNGAPLPGQPVASAESVARPANSADVTTPAAAGSPPFVEIGPQVQAGDTVSIVEMMKLMNNVVSDVAGTVTAIHVENAAQVEYGAALISIVPA